MIPFSNIAFGVGGVATARRRRRMSGDEDDVINKIINGKMDDIDVAPLKCFNERSAGRPCHQYALDIAACGSRVFATSDISNRINVWSLDTRSMSTSHDLIMSVKINDANGGDVSVWAMCFDEHDRLGWGLSKCWWPTQSNSSIHERYLFIGLSNGMLKSLDLVSQSVMAYSTSAPIGITHLVRLSHRSVSPAASLLLVGRLNGYLELVEFAAPSFGQADTLQVCALYSPLVNVACSSGGGDYVLAATASGYLKVIKINHSPLSLHQPSALRASLSLMFELSEHHQGGILPWSSPITAMCVDQDNCINAATGCHNGSIFLWNLFTGQCCHKLNKIQGAVS